MACGRPAGHEDCLCWPHVSWDSADPEEGRGGVIQDSGQSTASARNRCCSREQEQALRSLPRPWTGRPLALRTRDLGGLWQEGLAEHSLRLPGPALSPLGRLLI